MPVAGEFLETIRKAFREGDLSDARAIKQALMYENYSCSSPHLQQCLSNHPLWPGLDATRDSPGSSGAGIPPFAHCALPSRCLPSRGRTARLEPAERTIARLGTPAHLRLLSDARLPRDQRCSIFSELCKRDFAERPLLWVYLRTDVDALEPARLLMDLGLFSALGKSTGVGYLLFDMELSARRKPTWADAGLSWFFDAAPDTKGHGWTRSLASGERGYREWVVKGKHFRRLLDVLLIQPEGVPGEPAQAFWDYHGNRISAARGDIGNNGETES
jgi:hypothetical protein